MLANAGTQGPWKAHKMKDPAGPCEGRALGEAFHRSRRRCCSSLPWAPYPDYWPQAGFVISAEQEMVKCTGQAPETRLLTVVKLLKLALAKQSELQARLHGLTRPCLLSVLQSCLVSWSLCIV